MCLLFLCLVLLVDPVVVFDDEAVVGFSGMVLGVCGLLACWSACCCEAALLSSLRFRLLLLCGRTGFVLTGDGVDSSSIDEAEVRLEPLELNVLLLSAFSLLTDTESKESAV